MSLALFIAGAVFLVLTLHSLRPLRWPGTLVVPAWFASWPVIELAPHWIVGQAAVGGGLAAAGGLAGELGVAGLAMTGLSIGGLLIHIARARRTDDAFERALTRGLGGDVAAPEVDDEEKPAWLRLARLIPIRHPAVERIPNLAYHDGHRRRHTVDVYRRRDAEGGGRPVLLYVHGGGWVIGNKAQQGLLTVNRMAARGWVCLSINYRLSPRATFPDHIVDVKRAIRWARQNVADYGGDPDMIVIAGGSAGAHLAALAALTPNELEYQRDFPDDDTAVQGCIGYYGIYDFCDRHGHWPHRAFRMMLERAIMKCRFDRAQDSFDRASPIARVGAHAPPFLLIHGDRDNLAPVDESRRLADALREVSPNPVVLAELPGAQHAFELLPSIRSLAATDAVERFCTEVHRRHLDRTRGADVHSPRGAD